MTGSGGAAPVDSEMSDWPAADYQPRPGRKTGALVLISAFVVAVIVLGVVFFTGAIRIGGVKVSGVTTASRVDRVTGRPSDRRARFDDSFDRIYCCANARAFEDTILEARWYHGSAQIGSYRRSFGALTGKSTGKFLATGGNVAFYLDQPEGGWSEGKYTVDVLVNGKKAANAAFTVSRRTPDADALEPVFFKDPSGAFSVRYPGGWSQADASSLGGALAGFIEPGKSAFPARFAIVMTDFDSVSLDYLNGILEKAGAPASDLFTSYSLGDTRGARRTYSWQYRAGGSTVRLRSIQVLVKGSKQVYGLDCHCLEKDFKAKLPLFNSVINSFRVYG